MRTQVERKVVVVHDSCRPDSGAFIELISTDGKGLQLLFWSPQDSQVQPTFNVGNTSYLVPDVDSETRERFVLPSEAGEARTAAQLVSERLEDEQLRSREYITIAAHPEAGETPYARPGFMLSKTPQHTERHAPLYGQDIDYVLRDVLGMSDSDVQALEDAHVTARQPL